LKQLAKDVRVAGSLAAILLMLTWQRTVRADGYTKEQLGTVTRAQDDKSKPVWMQKMAGSSVELSSYVGSGSFYNSGYSNPYVSAAVFARPTYDLGTRLRLSANARVYVEQEFTKADNPNGRGFNPYDVWLWLSAKELHRFERSKIKLGAVARLVLPLSYESRYSHMVTGLGAGFNLNRTFEFGHDPVPEQRWILAVSLAGVFTKYFYTSDLRGSGPSDSTGCRAYLPAGLASGGTGGPTAAESDRCGGPVNTNFAVATSGTFAVSKGKWSLAAILLIANSFRYQVSADIEAMLPASAVGRSDTTWGIVSLGYSFTDRFGISVGLSSYQPALDSEYRHLRFPFFDLSGGANANNYTQGFVSLSGTL
jgi:hypothetical protein